MMGAPTPTQNYGHWIGVGQIGLFHVAQRESHRLSFQFLKLVLKCTNGSKAN